MDAKLSRRTFGTSALSLAAAAMVGDAIGQVPQPPPDRPKNLVIPGTGPRVARTGDDFEDEKWVYYPQEPKSSWNIDENVRIPGGVSQNQLWAEGAKRGQPDIVKRVNTPPGGIEGSKGCMMIQTRRSGVPGSSSGVPQQDDLLHNTVARLGRTIPVSWTPNCTCRVYVPAATQWEQRNGSSFGFRAGLQAFNNKGRNDEHWPGIFLDMGWELKDNEKKHFVRAIIRADEWGRDLPGPKFEPASWITLGMTFTPDGFSHFFARPGIEDLREEDHLGSYNCYNWRTHTFETYFFNVISMDDGWSWSTPWVIDDAFLHVATPPAQPRAAQAPGASTVK
ncbi:hypothetical protein Psta_4649 [Pirellula staleyi DSM 6068]|uniref:Uncharacterized protein n=1 Tax=Pirellula staleyi (strain ATCC 27377 / DSM 6068 / ICPB 4128) TaxID=530564 RepID=D2R7W0_PIRSD|nr:hypothetical protein [Pirellula staleyi]ADB19291.1 hypothetical protein Psta_4649 [Pirellula staleyi DSM 6068]